MSRTKYMSKKVIEANQGIEELDEAYESESLVSRLIFEDKRKELVGNRDALVKKRDRGVMLLWMVVISLFAMVYFGVKFG